MLDGMEDSECLSIPSSVSEEETAARGLHTQPFWGDHLKSTISDTADDTEDTSQLTSISHSLAETSSETCLHTGRLSIRKFRVTTVRKCSRSKPLPDKDESGSVETCKYPKRKNAAERDADIRLSSHSTSSLRVLEGCEPQKNLSSVQCFCCKELISMDRRVHCSHKGCHVTFHYNCAQQLMDCIWRKNGLFVCPHHACFACGHTVMARLWRCEMCSIAFHRRCTPWLEHVVFFDKRPGWAICWRHELKLRLAYQEVFMHLPLPDLTEEFSLSMDFFDEVAENAEAVENAKEPPPYTWIKRNEFLVKKKRDNFDDGVGCKCGSEDPFCGEDCECRLQSMSCSKSCLCSKVCKNKPFRKEKQLRVVKTASCGWGAEAAENIKKGEFVIEYVGEVINDIICERRLWAMKGRGLKNFYMCEIGKDFIIDATFKGNASRYLNHCCEPNCKLEKWRVEGETRVGVFALRDISIGEALTYDYKYVEFGKDVKCRCGARSCRGTLGERPLRTRFVPKLSVSWGEKQKRTFRQQT